MKITIKNEQDIKNLREGGKRLAKVVEAVSQKLAPGVTALELDEYAESLIRESGDVPAFLGYKQSKNDSGFPGTLCVSVNEGVVHGAPSADVIFKEGDVVKIDCGLSHNGMFVDHARTFIVGEGSEENKKLLNITEESLRIGIDAARAGNTTGDIGHAIEKFVNGRYGIIRSLAGHGVGYAVHEPPFIPNVGTAGHGETLIPGMVIAIEPMLTTGSEDVVVGDDGYTYETDDGSQSAHFEHTLLITENGPAEVFTILK